MGWWAVKFCFKPNKKQTKKRGKKEMTIIKTTKAKYYLLYNVAFPHDMDVPVHSLQQHSILLIIIIMEICKALTLWLKALNKHTRIMYIEMENVIKKIFKNIYRQVFKHNYAKHAHAHINTHTHKHTHTHCTDWWEWRTIWEILSWLLKKERVAECLMSWGKLYQM